MPTLLDAKLDISVSTGIFRVAREKGQGPADNFIHSWLGAIELTIAIGVTYFLAARFGLALRAQVGLAIFWPAAGIGVGALIALGPASRVPVAVGVALATIGSSLSIGRSAWLGIAFSVVNAVQALTVSWLIERWFDRRFTLEDVPQVLGFLVACGLGAAIGASGAAIAVSFVEPTAFPPQVWRLWFAACLLGTVTVAPLLIGIAEAVHRQPARRELVEGGAGVLALAGLSILLISLPQEPWESALPVALVFPILLWVTVRCRPLFAAAAAFVVALVIIWSTVSNTGHFGDTSIPLESRILAAQTHVLAAALLALVLAALFADRRCSEAALAQSHDRLQLALHGAELGAFRADLTTGQLECDMRTAFLHGHNVPPTMITESRRYVHPDDLVRIDAALAQAQRTGSAWNAEYRVRHPPNHPHAGETHWLAVDSSIIRDLQGNPVGLLGVTRDITGRKRAEENLHALNAELDHRVKNVLATVDAIVTQTQEASSSHADFVAGLNSRIKSLGRTHELLSESRWSGVSLAEIVRREFAPYAAGNAEAVGPRVFLKPEATQAVATVLHELTTNAAKYGAFSNGSGRVSVRWRWLQCGSHETLVINWEEIGGPPVQVPSHSGYGTSTIRELIPFELGGAVELVFAPHGARCRVDIPADWISRGGRLAKMPGVSKLAQATSGN
jgi:two-component sensor histidine kinase/integral membrane sensor domain MASE1